MDKDKILDILEELKIEDAVDVIGSYFTSYCMNYIHKNDKKFKDGDRIHIGSIAYILFGLSSFEMPDVKETDNKETFIEHYKMLLSNIQKRMEEK